MGGAPTLFALIASGITLAFNLYLDLKKGEISPWACAVLFVVASFEPCKDYAMSFLSAAIGFLPMFIVAVIGHGGAGDALLIGSLCYTLPLVFSVYMCLFASLSYVFALIPMIIKSKDSKKRLPYVPFICIGWLIILTFYLAGGFRA